MDDNKTLLPRFPDDFFPVLEKYAPFPYTLSRYFFTHPFTKEFRMQRTVSLAVLFSMFLLCPLVEAQWGIRRGSQQFRPRLFRNIERQTPKIKNQAPQGDGFVSLFNGKDLTGWTVKGGDATYSVDDGCIVGIVNDEKRNSFLCSEKEFENFIFKAEFKFDQDFNSGIQFRSLARPEGDRQRVYGYQCEMAARGMTAAIYDEGRRGRWLNVVTDEFTEKTKTAYKQGEWNTLEIQCVGPSIRTWLNGQPITDIFDTMTARGFFGLQVHAAKNLGAQVRWRNILVKELPSTQWIPFFKEKQFVGLEIKPAGKWEFQEDGSVHATSTKDEKKDGMLLSKEVFDNFAVRVSFKYGQGNSGMYFRAHEIDKPHWVCGFQCEIEGKVGGNHATCGLWEVGGGPSKGRGWVFKPAEENSKNFKVDAWNDISTVAVGDRIITNLNGSQVVDFVDPDCLKDGKTALQLHGGSDMEYWFKDYEIMPLSKEMVDLITR